MKRPTQEMREAADATVRRLHGLKGFEAWSDCIARALAAADAAATERAAKIAAEIAAAIRGQS